MTTARRLALVAAMVVGIVARVAPLAAQTADSATAAAVGERAGAADGRSASTSRVRWGSAATMIVTSVVFVGVAAAFSG